MEHVRVYVNLMARSVMHLFFVRLQSSGLGAVNCENAAGTDIFRFFFLNL